MITIRELLNRIRWDREYGRGDFAIGYFDRIEQRIVVVPLGKIPGTAYLIHLPQSPANSRTTAAFTSSAILTACRATSLSADSPG